MIFFKVSQNINIKIADNSLVVLNKENKNKDEEEYIYISTFFDFEAIKEIFKSVGDSYKTMVINEKWILEKKSFPIELGVSNKNEFLLQKQKQKAYSFLDSVESFNKDELYKNSDFVDIKTQLKVNKKDISIAIIGGVGRDIGEMINGLNALRILYKVLQKKYKNIKIDLFLESAQNQYYKRDKEFLEKDSTINQVLPLCIKLNKFMEYDYYIDNSLIYETTFYKELNYIDAYLYKFGIDSTKTDQHLKYNYYDMSFYQVPQELKNELDKIKKQSKIVLFHPFTPKADRSIPKDIANSFLKELISISDYSIVSALKIDKIENDKFFDLSRYSKSLFDFIYIISQADYIITADTSTYHISDLFLIPTVSVFSDERLAQKRLKYYQSTKAYILEEKKKNLSLLRFDNELLTINKYSKYKSLKAKKVLKLLDTIYQ